MKFGQDLYPMGTIPKQLTPGAYMNDYLANNLDIYARTIAKDMHFLIVISGNDGVGNGKTTIATQIGTYLTWKINQLHGTQNTFTAENIYFNAKKLTKESLKMPPLTVQLLDEGDDLTTHGMKELAIRLKRYFRKCRQLNQIVILILPSFFELPKFYAMSRSHCLINVKFHGEFERGIFDFYGFTQKKRLYIKGKKEWDYGCVKSSFAGNFNSNYNFLTENPAVDLEEEVKKYLEKKWKDTVNDQEDNLDEVDKKKWTRQIFFDLKERMPKVTMDAWATGFDVHKSTLYNWIGEEKMGNSES